MPRSSNHRPAPSVNGAATANHRPPPLPTPPVPPFAAPRGRPSWAGLLRFSLVSVPVKAYAAASSTTASHFHLLHAECGQRIQYQKHCPRHAGCPAGTAAGRTLIAHNAE